MRLLSLSLIQATVRETQQMRLLSLSLIQAAVNETQQMTT